MVQLSILTLGPLLFASLRPTEAFVVPSKSGTRISSTSANFLGADLQDEEATFTRPLKEYLVTCIPGLAPYLEEELLSCGAENTQVLSKAAVSFTASDMTVPLKCLLWVRTAHRFLELIDSFEDIESRDNVYDAVQHLSGIHIKDLLGDGKGGLLSLSVKVIANGRLPKDISHSHYTSLTIKNALVDQVRVLKDGERPDVDIDDPDVPLVAIFHSQGMAAHMSLYRSLSPPGSLHRRGYRSGGAIHKAAMKESLAAGLLLAAGWKDRVAKVRCKVDEGGEEYKDRLTFVDPMCGSGSLLLEAAMMTVDFAPGLMRIMNQVPGSRDPPVLRWKEYRDNLLPIWKELLLEASNCVKTGLAWMKENEGRVELLGNDIHWGALELVESSLKKAGGLDRIVRLHNDDCCDWNLMKEGEHRTLFVATNPPWGVRLSDDDHQSWESLRTFLRDSCPPGRTESWVLSGNKAATKHLGLRRSQSVPLKTGQQDLRWIQYIMLDKPRDSPTSAGADKDSERRHPQSSIPRHINPERIIRTRPQESRSSTRKPAVQSRRPRKVQRSRSPAVSREDDSWI